MPLPDALAAWTVESRTPVFAAPPWVTVDREAVRLPTGQSIPDFYRVVLPAFVVVVARTVDGRYPIVQGYKHGLGTDTLSPPAGQIDGAEHPLAAAQRELLEETGYVADDWQAIGTYIVDGNRQCGTMHLFAATGARSIGPPRVDDFEPLVVHLLSRSELLVGLQQGRFGTLPGAGGLALALLAADRAPTENSP